METIQHKAMEAILQRLTVPKRYAKKVRDSHRASPGILRHLVKRPPPKPAETYRLLKGQSDESLLLLMAGTKSKTVKHRLSAYLTSYQQVQPVLTGTDLKAMGLKPGPQYRKILERLVEARLNGQVTSEAEERELVKQIARL
jgi:tRNA nucleotidyltransferase (CCA-adding enzyme)